MTEMLIKVKRNKNIEKRLNIEITNNQVTIKRTNLFLKLTKRLVPKINDFLVIYILIEKKKYFIMILILLSKY